MAMKHAAICILACTLQFTLSTSQTCPLKRVANLYLYECNYNLINNPQKHPVRPVNKSYRNVTVAFTTSYIPILTDTIMDIPSNYDLISLTINRCKMQDVDSRAFRLYSHLSKLSIINNNITSINATMLNNLSNLVFLDLSHNNIDIIKAGAFDALKSLRELNVSHNRVSKLGSRYFYNLHFIQRINFSHNHISELDDTAFDNAITLLNLDLSHNDIKEVPELRYLHSLQNLSLGANFIKELSQGMFNSLKSLRWLDLSGNRLTSIEWIAFEDIGVESVNFAGNELTGIDLSEMLKIRSLRNVTITNNNFSCEYLEELVNKMRFTGVKLNLGWELDVLNIHGIACSYYVGGNDVTVTTSAPSSNVTEDEDDGSEFGDVIRLSHNIFMAVIFVIVILLIYGFISAAECFLGRFNRRMPTLHIKELEPMM